MVTNCIRWGACILIGFTFVAPVPPPIPEPVEVQPLPPNPCNPPPCGANAQCSVVSGQAQCVCLANMIGTAPNCRPECVLSSDCSANRACVNKKCVDPCPGACGVNAECRVVNHKPVCLCTAGHTGDAFNGCRPLPVVGKVYFRSHRFSEQLWVLFITCYVYQIVVSRRNSQGILL